jgi:hypothetical protein
MINTEPIKFNEHSIIVGFRKDFEIALENHQESANAYIEALEREIAEKGLDFVVKRLRAKHQSEMHE